MTSEERRESRFLRRRAKRDAQRALAHRERAFEQIFSFENLYRSYRKCCLGVGWKKSTQLYRANAMMNVAKAHWALMNGKFKSKGFYEFDIFERGKPRHIRAVHINERVIQRCLCDYALVSLLSRSFIYDNGASMKGKGISFAIDRCTKHLRSFWSEHGMDGYVLTFDIKSFFDSIPHDHLMGIVSGAVDDARLVGLTQYFVDAFGDVGLGLGSQVSQISALASLSPLDHKIKEKAGIRYYARYMDDGYLIHQDKAHLERCRAAIARYLESIGMRLNHKKTQITPLRRGFTFLKIRFNLTETGRVVRRCNRAGVARQRRKLKTFKRWVDDPAKNFTVEDARTSHESWKGHRKCLDAWSTIQRMEQLYQSLFGEEQCLCTRL